MPIFSPFIKKQESPAKSNAFQYLAFYRRFLFSFLQSILRRKNPLALHFETHFFLSGLLLRFPFKFFDFIMEKTVVFIDIPTDRIQHEFFIYFFRRTVVKATEVFILLDITKMPFRLDGTNLTF